MKTINEVPEEHTKQFQTWTDDMRLDYLECLNEVRERQKICNSCATKTLEAGQKVLLDKIALHTAAERAMKELKTRWAMRVGSFAWQGVKGCLLVWGGLKGFELIGWGVHLIILIGLTGLIYYDFNVTTLGNAWKRYTSETLDASGKSLDGVSEESAVARRKLAQATQTLQEQAKRNDLALKRIMKQNNRRGPDGSLKH